MTQTSLNSTLHASSDDREVLVRVENVSKKFCRSLKKSLWYGVQDIAAEVTGQKTDHALRPDEFWAVKDVSFELRRGECLGLIGRNGAGKSTLLRMLNGLIKPDRGRIELNGRVGGLIALGAGFNPTLTGRENVYVNGSVLGLSKAEIDAKFEEIVEFSELEEFIDAPVQSYSSGMNVRLGFSVAAVLLKPDILLLDEVLAVGDINFQIKCGRRIRELAPHSAVIFVSHSMYNVSWFCSRVMVLSNGEILQDATNPADGITKYLSITEIKQETSGTGEATISNFQLMQDSGLPVPENARFSHGDKLSVEFEIHVKTPQSDVKIFLVILDESNNGVVYLPVKDGLGDDIVFSKGVFRLSIPLGTLDLNAGRYSFLAAIVDANTSGSTNYGSTILRQQGIHPFQVAGECYSSAKIVRPVVAIVK
ncbi:ABC transporter ATP-binding protein [Lyngbya confervoides]|uniref:ABC transporter ATP-binding protein n=1 Tax=Lyngbya confervoides BDU141951 TaxID=1574623 RepID=A0ABD4T377_9CYAN|nr:ABC transporter ATP-binding protein [Lyngbya confervoides]MCM1983002.1 ABC transporter ATP-binding protein [Lyngbya confervoides BDU141951]